LPPPVGPYTPVVRAGDWLIVSGQLGRDEEGNFASGGVAGQTRKAIENIGALLQSEGASLSDVVKTTVLLASIDDYSSVNDAYVESFASHRPARSAFATGGLPLNALVEIEAWAYLPS
jgi:2-iminobutanoate/2-iminopropanoate deaminase